MYVFFRNFLQNNAKIQLHYLCKKKSIKNGSHYVHFLFKKIKRSYNYIVKTMEFKKIEPHKIIYKYLFNNYLYLFHMYYFSYFSKIIRYHFYKIYTARILRSIPLNIIISRHLKTIF